MGTPFRSGQLLGWIPGLGGTGSVSVNAAANWFGVSFVPDASRTLSTVRVYVTALVGALASGDITASLYDSTGTSGVPGSLIASGLLPTATITGAGWYTFTGFTTALTAGQMYYSVFKNANAAPTTNYCTFQEITNANLGGSYLLETSAANRAAWESVSSANSGSTWSKNSTAAFRVGYADGTFDGAPISNVGAAAIGLRVFSTNECGLKFTSPANAILNVRGVAWLATSPTGSPTGNPRAGIWTGSTPVNQGYTADWPNGTVFLAGGGVAYAYFASPIAIAPNTIVRVTLGEDTNSDTSAKGYNLMQWTWDPDSNSTPLLPWNGTAQITYFNGSTWSDSALGTGLFGHALLLDTAGEFGSSGGGAVLSRAFLGMGA